jgi:hypothetical protein
METEATTNLAFMRARRDATLHHRIMDMQLTQRECRPIGFHFLRMLMMRQMKGLLIQAFHFSGKHLVLLILVSFCLMWWDSLKGN